MDETTHTAADVRALRLKSLESRIIHEQVEQPRETNDHGQDLAVRKKELEKVVVFGICDEKHNSPSMILENIKPLIKILLNVKDNPEEPKYRKLRYNNPFVQKRILDTPSEKLLRLVGWTTIVEDFEKHLVYNHQPKSIEWELLGLVIEKLENVQERENSRMYQSSQLKANVNLQKETILSHIRQDEEERHARFRYQ